MLGGDSVDSGYDDHNLYNLSIERGFELVSPASSERLLLIYWRSISVEPLIEHIKDVELTFESMNDHQS